MKRVWWVTGTAASFAFVLLLLGRGYPWQLALLTAGAIGALTYSTLRAAQNLHRPGPYLEVTATAAGDPEVPRHLRLTAPQGRPARGTGSAPQREGRGSLHRVPGQSERGSASMKRAHTQDGAGFGQT